LLDDARFARLNTAGPRYTSYPTAPCFSQEFDAQAHARRLAEAGRAGVHLPLSLYVHLPFCQEMCTFCGCNVVVAKDRSKADRYLDHVEREADLVAGLLGDRRRLSQVHWGGGTPTFLDVAQLERLWRIVSRCFAVLPEAEVAIEVDPVVTTRAQLELLASLGFNRLSAGVQDFDPVVQQAVRRVQSVEQTAAVVESARALGFLGVNLDMIYGLPHQNQQGWAKSLASVIALRPDRVAVYSFAYVPDVRPHQKRLPVDALPRGRAKLDLFLQARAAFLNAGYRPIGMDHFALPGDELSLAQQQRTLTRNFQGYTVRAAPDTVALGVTGISDIGGAYAQNVRPLPRYYAALQEGRLATERGVVLTDDDVRRRALITQLMCNFWVDLGEDAGRYDRELDELRGLEAEGLLRVRGREIEMTEIGRLFVRNVAMVFDRYLREPERKAAFSQTV
jgi:oxygen-independent coproporphyrinogen-3 oxidase